MANKITIIGRYIGNGETTVIEDKIFERFVWTEANVSSETYNKLLQGEKDGWFNFYEPVSKLELKQILANILLDINEEISDMKFDIDNIGGADFSNLNARLDKLATSTNNSLDTIEDDIDSLKQKIDILGGDFDLSSFITKVQLPSLPDISDIKNLSIESGTLQLTNDKYQTATISSSTKINMPEVDIEDQCVKINLIIIKANQDLVLQFDDIKWIEIPHIKNGFDYIFSFVYINKIWYGQVTEYRKFEKSYLYKDGDECVTLSGGWDYIWVQNWSYGAGTVVNPDEYSKEKYGWAKREDCIEYQGYHYGLNYGYMQYFQTVNAINFSNYAKMYVEYSIEKHTDEDGSEEDVSTPVHIKVGNTTLMSKRALTYKTIGEFDVSSISGSQKVGFGLMAETAYTSKTNKLKIYKIWLEGNETKTDKEIIYEDIGNLQNQINNLSKKSVTRIAPSSDNKLAILSNIYQKATLSANTELSLPTLSSPKDITIEIIPSSDITITWKSGTNIKIQNNLTSLKSGNIYELCLGYDGEYWIGGWISYESVS